VPTPIPRLRLAAYLVATTLAFLGILEGGSRVAFPSIARAPIVADPPVVDVAAGTAPDARDISGYPAIVAQTACACDAGSDPTCRLGPPLREQAVPCAKRPGAARVLFLGESSVWGTRLADDETIPAQIARVAAERGRRVEAINGGIQGEDLETVYRVLLWALPRLRPDAVVIYAGHNEVYALSPSFNGAVLQRFYPRAPWVRRAYRAFAFPRVAAALVRRTRTRAASGAATGYDGLPGGDVALSADQAIFLDNLRARVIDRARTRLSWSLDLCRDRGLPVLVALPTSNLLRPPASPTHGPSYAAHREAFAAARAEADRAFRRHQWAAALAPLAEAARLDPGYATTDHLQGVALLHLGRTDEARAAMDRALDGIRLYRMVGEGQDGAPPALSRALADAATARGVPVWDAGRAVRGGNDPSDDERLFVDYLHFSALGARRFAEGLVGEMTERGWLR
jgi:lysophospholipase L1-like esterase